MEKKFEKISKKCLTNGDVSGIISKLSTRTGSQTKQTKSSLKKVEKTWKKYLTNEFECDMIAKLTARAASDTVPCKLNNVKTNYEHLGHFKWMFKFRLKSNLSQRKFLSIFAKTNLFKTLIWARKRLDTIFWEFDPGSGRTLAACLTHASRTELELRF